MSPKRAADVEAPEVVDDDLDEIEMSKEPSYSFRLGGRVFHCRSKDDLHFDTIEKWLIARENGAGSIAVAMDAFFSAMLFPDEVESFLAMKADPTGPGTTERMTRLIERVNEKVLGLPGAADPTRRPAASGRGSKATAPTPKVEHSGRVSKKASAA